MNPYALVKIPPATIAKLEVVVSHLSNGDAFISAILPCNCIDDLVRKRKKKDVKAF